MAYLPVQIDGRASGSHSCGGAAPAARFPNKPSIMPTMFFDPSALQTGASNQIRRRLALHVGVRFVGALHHQRHELVPEALSSFGNRASQAVAPKFP